MENNLYIAHYGILGQKWGVQNGPPYPLSNVQKSSAERKIDTGKITNKKPSYHVSTKQVKKDMDSMTDAELQRAINRINMQQQVDKMNPSYMDRGRKVVEQYRKDTLLISGALAASLGLLAVASKLG